MKFSAVLTSFILLVPLLAGEAFAVPAGNQNNGTANNNTNNKGAANNTAAAAANKGGNNGNNNNGNNNKNNNGNNNAQTSLTLDPKVIATGFEQNGQAVPTAGQVASLTSSNNFINFCLTVPNKPITNGQQIKTGSCNPAPMGVIAANTNMPAAKFVVPVNGQNFGVNQSFTIQMAINHLETGNFVNAQANYYAAPQQVNAAGDIVGHSHFTVQAIPSFTSTTPLDSSVFAFFKGVNSAAVNGVVSETVANGLGAGTYRLCSMNTDANHTPALVAVAQHGSLDDCVYFSVGGAGGANPFNGGNAANNATAAAGNNNAAKNGTAAAGNNKGNKGKGGRRNKNGRKEENRQARFVRD